MRQSWIQIDGELVPANEAALSAVHHVMPDLEPFTANTGAHIEGRRQWREHLKASGCHELGHADIKAGVDGWEKRKAAAAAKRPDIAKYAPPVEVREDFEPSARSRLAAEVLNRLDGKATPSRKEVIRLTLELAKRGRYGRR
jgi:hypothetical protein